ncbi:MAG TPA: hypothetical protein VGM56_06595 [Byssovorax sp.]
MAVSALAFTSGVARADDASKAFADGRTRFNAKDFAGALPLFRKAFDASKSPNAELYVGLCLVELKQPVDAYEAMSIAERDSSAKMAQDPSYAHTRDVAAGVRAKLEKEIGRVVVTIDGAPSPPQVVVNGAALAPERVGAPFAVAPGPVTIVATSEGAPPVREKADVAAGEQRTIALRFHAGSALLPARPGGTEPAASPSWFTPMRTAGVIVAGVGVAGLAAFAVTGLMANSTYSSVQSACGGRCSAADPHASDISKGRTLDTVADVTLGVGAAALVGGAALVLFGGPKAGTPHTSLVVSPRFVGVGGTFR